jgi:hypothetical protein
MNHGHKKISLSPDGGADKASLNPQHHQAANLLAETENVGFHVAARDDPVFASAPTPTEFLRDVPADLLRAAYTKPGRPSLWVRRVRSAMDEELLKYADAGGSLAALARELGFPIDGAGRCRKLSKAVARARSGASAEEALTLALINQNAANRRPK